MEKFSEMKNDERDLCLADINRRWRELWEREKDWAERGFRYCFLVNTGGAIATMSYLSQSPTMGIKIALLLFVLGVISVGVATAFMYHNFDNMFKQWRMNFALFMTNKIAYYDMLREDEAWGPKFKWPMCSLYISLGCFLLGCFIGFLYLFCG